MKIATFKNVECHYDDGSIEEVNQNDLLASNNNNFKGRICWAGLQEIYIDTNGNGYDAGQTDLQEKKDQIDGESPGSYAVDDMS